MASSFALFGSLILPDFLLQISFQLETFCKLTNSFVYYWSGEGLWTSVWYVLQKLWIRCSLVKLCQRLRRLEKVSTTVQI